MKKQSIKQIIKQIIKIENPLALKNNCINRIQKSKQVYFPGETFTDSSIVFNRAVVLRCIQEDKKSIDLHS